MPPVLDRTLRAVAAVLILIQGATHVLRWLDGYRAVEVVGPLFVVNAVVALAVAALVLVRGGLVSALAGMVLSFATLVAFALSRQASLFGFAETRWDAVAFVSVGAEVAAVLVLLAWATLATRRGSTTRTMIQRDLRRLGLATPAS
jgi:2-methylcitrate dehydratase PrpD